MPSGCQGPPLHQSNPLYSAAINAIKIVFLHSLLPQIFSRVRILELKGLFLFMSNCCGILTTCNKATGLLSFPSLSEKFTSLTRQRDPVGVYLCCRNPYYSHWESTLIRGGHHNSKPFHPLIYKI